MQFMKKLTKKVMRFGGLKTLFQDHRRRLIGYEKLHFSSAISSSMESVAPAGHFPVYVGEERQRFVIPTAFLSHPLFAVLLDKAYEEYGFKHNNGLRIPCNVSVFMHVVSVVDKNN